MHTSRFSRVLSALCTLALLLTLIPCAFADTVSPAVSDNRDQEDCTTYGKTVTSYLFENPSGGLTRVEYIDGTIVVEDYSSSFELQNSRTIPMELSLWGGFYAGEDYNFFVFGQKNTSQSDSVEVFRIVKYSKDWQRLDQASVYGANTLTPFDAGSCRMDEYNGYLYIRTCHTMYTTSDGYNHQANVTLNIRQRDMEVTDGFYGIYNESWGYISHSFNQFLMVDTEGRIVCIDLEEGQNRGVAFFRYYEKAGQDKFRPSNPSNPYANWGSYGLQAQFAGSGNYTGGSIGGLTQTSDCYMYCYNYDDAASQNLKDRTPHLFAMDIATGKGKDYKISGSTGSTTPALVSNSDGGYMLWNGKSKYDITDTLYYLTFGADGVPGEIQSATASLSDCAPIYYQGKVVWYVTDNSAPVFYQLDSSGLKKTETVPSVPVNPEPETPSTPTTPTVPENPSTPSTPSTSVTAPCPDHTISLGAAIRSDGSLIAWGHGLGETDGDITTLGTDFKSVCSDNVYLALKNDGTLYAWGMTENEYFNTTMKKVSDGVAQIDNVLALMQDGSVRKLPINSTRLSSPVLSGVSQISQNDYYPVALKQDGTVWADLTGNNTFTQLADHAVRVSGNLILKDDGTLWSWGKDYHGSRGNGSAGGTEPVMILSNVVNAWNGTCYNGGVADFALTSDGTLYSWGENYDNSLGYAGGNQTDGESIWQDSPRQVFFQDVADISTCGNTTMILKTDGSLWFAGQNGDLLPEPTATYGVFSKIMDGILLPGQEPSATPSTPQAPQESQEPQEQEPQTPENPQTPVTIPTFSDIPSSFWAAASITKAVSMGLVNGMGDGTFAPDNNVTSAQFITLVTRAFYSSDLNAQTAGSYWYSANLNVANQHSLLSSTGVYNMDANINRYDMAQIVYNYLKENGTAPTSAEISIALAGVSDGGQIPATYRNAVGACVAAGLIRGMDDSGTFGGNGNMTRAQAATLFVRMKG